MQNSEHKNTGATFWNVMWIPPWTLKKKGTAIGYTQETIRHHGREEKNEERVRCYGTGSILYYNLIRYNVVFCKQRKHAATDFPVSPIGANLYMENTGVIREALYPADTRLIFADTFKVFKNTWLGNSMKWSLQGVITTVMCFDQIGWRLECCRIIAETNDWSVSTYHSHQVGDM